MSTAVFNTSKWDKGYLLQETGVNLTISCRTQDTVDTQAVVVLQYTKERGGTWKAAPSYEDNRLIRQGKKAFIISGLVEADDGFYRCHAVINLKSYVFDLGHLFVSK